VSVQNYRELIVWKKAIDLVEDVYRLTSCFPKTEIYALTGQIRRATVSVPSNIAEGQGGANQLASFCIFSPWRTGRFWKLKHKSRLPKGSDISIRNKK